MIGPLRSTPVGRLLVGMFNTELRGRHTILLSAVLIFGVLLPMGTVSAIDWGGGISSSATVRSIQEDSEDEPWANSSRLFVYFNTPLGARYRLETQAAARLDAEPFLLAADVERFYLERVREPAQDNLNEFVTRIGRQTIADPAGLVVRQVVDGITLIARYPRGDVRLAGGYAGLVNREFSTVSMSLRDSLDGEDEYYFGPPRLIGEGRVSFNNVVAGQSLRLGFVFQEDLRELEVLHDLNVVNDADVVQPGQERRVLDEEGIDPGGLLDTQYVLATLEGPIGRGRLGRFYYDAAYVLNLGRTLSLVEDDATDSGRSYQYKPIRAHLGSFRLQHFLPSFMASAAGIGVTYSTGDGSYDSFVEGNTEGNATMYTPVSPVTKGIVFALGAGNTTVAEVFYSVKPFEEHRSALLSSFQARLAGYSFFRSAGLFGGSGEGPVSATAVDAESDETYLGSEIDLALRFRPFSDLGFSVSGGVFLGNEDALLEDANTVDYLVRVDASLSF